ncbi:MAG: hypothetical protein FWH56_10195 [Betaproteobacteria bacterium]|nr:hypothetical protein [Betaproteobacteria bacterium]
MKTLRILLQLVIVTIAGGIVFAALISPSVADLRIIIPFLGFTALLFSATLVLKEFTEKRLNPGHKLSFKPVGIVLILSGVFFIFIGVNYSTGNQQPWPNSSGRCDAICGLTLLALQLFGETFARFFAFSLFTGIGLFLCFVGYRVKRVKEI